MNETELKATLRNFTPLMDDIVEELGLISAAVWGRVWRYAQQKDKVCTASIETIAKALCLSKRTVINHLQILVDSGYLKDHTPNLRNKPHTYSVTRKAYVRVIVEGVVESRTTEIDNQNGMHFVPNGMHFVPNGMHFVPFHSARDSLEETIKKQVNKEIKKEEVEENYSSSPPDEQINEDTLKKLKHGGVSITHRDALNIFSMVTGMVHVPGNDMSYVEKIRALTDEHKEGVVDYLRQFWERWTTSKTKDGRLYSKTNLGWIDWAIAGEMPEKRSSNVIKAIPGQERQPYERT